MIHRDYPTKATSTDQNYGLPRDTAETKPKHTHGRKIAPDNPTGNRAPDLPKDPTKTTKIPPQPNNDKEHNHNHSNKNNEAPGRTTWPEVSIWACYVNYLPTGSWSPCTCYLFKFVAVPHFHAIMFLLLSPTITLLSRIIIINTILVARRDSYSYRKHWWLCICWSYSRTPFTTCTWLYISWSYNRKPYTTRTSVDRAYYLCWAYQLLPLPTFSPTADRYPTEVCLPKTTYSRTNYYFCLLSLQ